MHRITSTPMRGASRLWIVESSNSRSTFAGTKNALVDTPDCTVDTCTRATAVQTSEVPASKRGVFQRKYSAPQKTHVAVMQEVPPCSKVHGLLRHAVCHTPKPLASDKFSSGDMPHFSSSPHFFVTSCSIPLVCFAKNCAALAARR
eukprot:TRINITY_DN62147_c0_g1_i1.p1 TRINITY_DN62147_c0_g1~~TRINITY_DN62147_c0_g1_i1.p1  ORF type:complete len:146 (-),score=9.41 TRINITY_DN62147_c0_g1_i1:134-571(-)